MSIQTTRYVTRKEAESIFVDQRLENKEKQYREIVTGILNSELEDDIETDFTNYIIEEDKNDLD